MIKTILLVDDDPPCTQRLEDIFAHTNYKLITANNAKKALEILRAQAIELVITAYSLPDLDGVAFMEQAKAIRPELIFIVTSELLNPDTVRSLINAGIGGVFTKPLNVFGLLKCAVSLLEQPPDYNTFAPSEPAQSSAPNSLKNQLENFREDYERAIFILCHKDAQLAAETLATPTPSACCTPDK